MKTLLTALYILCAAHTAPMAAHCGPIASGQGVSDLSLPDANGRSHRISDYSGKAILINIVSPDAPDMNAPVTDAVKRAVEDGTLDETRFKGIGIADCKTTWKPDFLIRAIGRARGEKYHALVLFDYHGAVQAQWGHPSASPCIIILDKRGICRLATRQAQTDSQVQLILDTLKGVTNE